MKGCGVMFKLIVRFIKSIYVMMGVLILVLISLLILPFEWSYFKQYGMEFKEYIIKVIDDIKYYINKI